MDSSTTVFEGLRPLMFAIAYRMVASVADTEDILQEAFLRYHRAVTDGVEILSAKSYLSAVTTRLSIDHLRSARVRRETYVGTWLPEPLLTGSSLGEVPAVNPADHAQQADSLSMAFLLVLERLNPVERATFLLHDVFDFEYSEIAAVVDKTPQNCRQLVVRARRHLREHRPRFEVSRARREQLADAFMQTFDEGDVNSLVSMLAADVVLYGDSGGISPSWPRPIVGADKVARLLVGLARMSGGLGVTARRVEVNGQPGAIFRDPAGRLINIFAFDIVDGTVHTIRSVINPGKLGHLGPLADVQGLWRGRQAPPADDAVVVTPTRRGGSG